MQRSGAALIRLFVALASACGGDDATVAIPEPDAHSPPRLVLYLAFDGVTLHPGEIADASADTTPIVDADLTLPPYLDGHADRQTRIDAIVAETRARVAPFDVEVVAERPLAAPYFEIVFTGNSTLVGAPPGIGGIAPRLCDRDQPTAIGLEFSSLQADDTYGPKAHANWILSILGIAHRVPVTKVRHDCMCWVGSVCQNGDEVVCSIGGAGTPVDADYACEGSPETIDEGALLHAALGTRL